VGSSQQVTIPNIASQDAASEALAAAHRADEAKQLYRKADAVWIYAQRLGDYDLQNEAAEIRLFAHQRMGELRAEMAIDSSSRRQGQPRRDGAKIGRSMGAVAYPDKPEETGVIKGKSSKWHQFARWMRALSPKSRIVSSLRRGLRSSSPRTL
jgi:hypothetical protein